MKITINSGLIWMKVLKQRHSELVQLRNENSSETRQLFGEKQTIDKKPVYDIKKLDKLINQVAKEMRKLDESIKTMNAKTIIDDYDKNEDVLGEVE